MNLFYQVYNFPVGSHFFQSQYYTIIHCWEKKLIYKSGTLVIQDQQAKNLVLTSPTIIQEYSHAYPSLVFDVDISSFLDKAFHCVIMVFSNRNMQRSPLVKKIKKKYAGGVISSVIPKLANICMSQLNRLVLCKQELKH